MASDDTKKEPEVLPFRRHVTVQQPGIVGAQWWNDGLSAMGSPVNRRGALKALLVVGGTVAVGGIGIASQIKSSEPDYDIEMLDTLETQRSQGWNFGAPDESLSFTGQVPVSHEETSLHKFATEMSPKQDRLKPFYQATLFQALAGTVPSTIPSAVALRAAVKPVLTPAMDTAFRQGQALARLFEESEEVTRATVVMVDLPGPEAVAFAAGLSRSFEPVFTFDNWPHPRGLVPAHLTLGAALYYRPLLERTARRRSTSAPPVLVLDRNRLLPYTKPQTQFDNRYLARLPPAARLTEMGFKHVLYVAPGDGPLQELDDINEDFVSYREARLDVKSVAASDFQPAPSEPSLVEDVVTTPYTSDVLPELQRRPFYFGGSPVSHSSFWMLYPWLRGATAPAMAAVPNPLPPKTAGGHRYEPQRRATMFSLPPSSASGAPRPKPTGFAKVQVKVAAANRQILGFAYGSYSSWNRAPTAHSSSSSGYSSYGG
ncbi:hypothetical protein [Hyalangium rubrum]|uniref:Uncharacterized protein n=1 Tax=Hyalangium rubrum TaxID=3103134 RepID=A0ABU5H9K9_9BACT|nr:hypothetical protein [Hyalangium sp. s54d21]MDY7228790.1 hypothetical protein [Hyalangium sp. s54d21]